MPDVPLKCRCGSFRAVLHGVTPGRSNRVSCYCDDCQTFAHHCGAEDVLDEWAGTDICQVSPKQLEILEGRDQLAVLKLSPRSGTYRWTARCCATPICNTSPKVPFLGVVHTAMDLDDTAMDAAFGPRCRTVQTRFATGNHDALSAQAGKLGMLKVVRLIAGWWVSGHGRHNPLFPNGEPLVEPDVMPLDTRQALLERCGPEPTVSA